MGNVLKKFDSSTSAYSELTLSLQAAAAALYVYKLALIIYRTQLTDRRAGRRLGCRPTKYPYSSQGLRNNYFHDAAATGEEICQCRHARDVGVTHTRRRVISD